MYTKISMFFHLDLGINDTTMKQICKKKTPDCSISAYAQTLYTKKIFIIVKLSIKFFK